MLGDAQQVGEAAIVGTTALATRCSRSLIDLVLKVFRLKLRSETCTHFPSFKLQVKKVYASKEPR